MKRFFTLSFLCLSIVQCLGQLALPTDYLTKDFHKGRREALRQMLPANSVMVIFASPMRNFANDVDYKYHPNPDLYYFSGYTEPSSVLFIFKEPQKDSANKSYSDLFFVQKRNEASEQWTGRRLGIEGAKEKLGFTDVYNSADFTNFSLDLTKLDKVIFEFPQEVSDKLNQADDMHDIIESFKKKASIPKDYDADVIKNIVSLSHYWQSAGKTMLPRIVSYYGNLAKTNDRYKNNSLAGKLVASTDSTAMATVFNEVNGLKWNSALYSSFTNSLRQIKTPEELMLMRKAIDISALAHNEAMKAIKPDMSELELQGLQEYIHKKLGAEYVGYPSIVGVGNNGCVLHYIENNVTNLGNRMVLMDVGAEYHGYSADVTRTFPANGKFSTEQKQIYDIVYEAQEAVFKICKEGTSFEQIEQTANDVVAKGLVRLGILKDEKESRTYYPHGCSHFLGLDVHDKGNYDSLLQNMIITVEPGIYIPEGSNCDKKWWGIAVRIEDDVLIGKDKYELMSSLAVRKTEDIEKMVAQKSFVDAIKIELRK